MNTAMWIVVGVVVWLAFAALVGLTLGGVVRRRDRQTPHDVTPPGDPDEESDRVQRQRDLARAAWIEHQQRGRQ